MSEKDEARIHVRKMLKSPTSMSDEEIDEMVSPVAIIVKKESFHHLVGDLDAVNEQLKKDNRELWNFSDMIMSDMFEIYNSDKDTLNGVEVLFSPPDDAEEIEITVYKWVADRLRAMAEKTNLSINETIVRLHVIAFLLRQGGIEMPSPDEDIIKPFDDTDHKMFG